MASWPWARPRSPWAESALGPYLGAAGLDYELLDVLRWGGATAALLPFAAGWLVAPGAALGLGYL